MLSRTSAATRIASRRTMHPVGRLDNKIAIITGGAAGIGRATALRMAQEGASVVARTLASERPPAMRTSVPRRTAMYGRSTSTPLISGICGQRSRTAVSTSGCMAVRRLGALSSVSISVESG
jgi:hypothetical protein